MFDAMMNNTCRGVVLVCDEGQLGNDMLRVHCQSVHGRLTTPWREHHSGQ